MVDIGVTSGAAWVCQAQGRQLTDVLLPLHLSQEDEDEEFGVLAGGEKSR